MNNQPIFGQTAAPSDQQEDREMVGEMPHAGQAVLEALANTTGWAVGPVKRRGRKYVNHLSESEETRLELWFTDNDQGTARVRAILAAIGKAP